MNAGRTRLFPGWLRVLVAVTGALALVALSGIVVARLGGPPDESPAAAPRTGPARLHDLAAAPGRPGPDGDPARSTLVLYHHRTGDTGLAHESALQAANLASRGGTWTVRPIEEYAAGDLAGHDAAIYVGTPDTDPLPRAFLDDVARARTPVLWLGEGVEQLLARHPDATGGWRPDGHETRPVPTVRYKDHDLVRVPSPDVPLVRIAVTDPAAVQVLGTAVPDGGDPFPWAVRSGRLTYIGEIPFSYVDARDRYLAAADLVLRLVAPDAPQRRRALVRIEDVGPNTDPAQIRGIADTLSARGIPFSLATYPYYRDPNGTVHGGTPAAFRLVDAPELVAALAYARSRGATIVMHGYTHQLDDLANPYDGTSGADYEFYRAHVDDRNTVQLDGPVPGDSVAWAAQRLAVGRAEFVRAGLPDPDIFEFPHYTASAADYQAVHDTFGVRYDQGTYFADLCPAGRCATTTPAGADGLFQQYFPYPVRDVYGSVVIPENLGNVSFAFNDNEARSPHDIVEAAAAMTVVTDGVASTFFHPFLPVEQLAEVVDGIEGLGYTFVAPYDVLGVPGPRP